MKVSFFVTVQIVILFLSSCAKKAQPETTLNREGDSSINSNSGENGFNEGADDLAGLGDPLRGDFDNTDPLALRDPSLSAFDDPLNVIRPFDPVFFGFDQYNITATERPKISEIADFMKSNVNARLLVEGYCDWKGTPNYNKSLGDRRATTVKEYLIELGCEANRIEVISLGDELAIPDADSEQSRLDRRATFVVSKG
ncbi:OmpA family protein [Opitutales bacterium]|nr:OmpA family protein [Opitutales bacterium]MDC1006172.1 OmpA family protein [Opitutales bacterium]